MSSIQESRFSRRLHVVWYSRGRPLPDWIISPWQTRHRLLYVEIALAAVMTTSIVC